jgi:hypothetical protein
LSTADTRLQRRPLDLHGRRDQAIPPLDMGSIARFNRPLDVQDSGTPMIWHLIGSRGAAENAESSCCQVIHRSAFSASPRDPLPVGAVIKRWRRWTWGSTLVFNCPRDEHRTVARVRPNFANSLSEYYAWHSPATPEP